uniref:Lysozyme g n=1 Tax=Cyprinus carpio TaxID=7962 RepID=A0A8C1UMJ0_CYPCA
SGLGTGFQVIFSMLFLAYLYGDMLKIDTTGASEVTAKQYKLTIKGVEASKKLAEIDLPWIEKYKSTIIKVGRTKKMEPAVIAAIISRESRAGVDKCYHALTGTWDSELHIVQAVSWFGHVLLDLAQDGLPSLMEQ